jgi:hypothetical protein
MLRARSGRQEAVESQSRCRINRRRPAWVRYRLHETPVRGETQTRRSERCLKKDLRFSEYHRRKQKRTLHVPTTLPRPNSDEELSSGNPDEHPRKSAETRRGLARTLTFLLASLATFVSSRA